MFHVHVSWLVLLTAVLLIGDSNLDVEDQYMYVCYIFWGGITGFHNYVFTAFEQSNIISSQTISTAISTNSAAGRLGWPLKPFMIQNGISTRPIAGNFYIARVGAEIYILQITNFHSVCFLHRSISILKFDIANAPKLVRIRLVRSAEKWNVFRYRSDIDKRFTKQVCVHFVYFTLSQANFRLKQKTSQRCRLVTMANEQDSNRDTVFDRSPQLLRFLLYIWYLQILYGWK